MQGGLIRMVITHDNHLGYKFDRVWFNYDYSSKADIIRFSRVDHPLIDKWYVINDKNETIINTFDLDEDALFSTFKKNVKYEIRRAQKEGVQTTYCCGSKLSRENTLIEEFEVAYKKCAEDIKDYDLMSAFSQRKIYTFSDQGVGYISKAFIDSIEVFHFYIFGDEYADLLYSVSNFRNDADLRYLAGMANKYLHFEDMCNFRKMGVKSLDWGNISSSESPNGIDLFKMSFGGKVAERYNVFYGNTLKGKILVGLKKRFKR